MGIVTEFDLLQAIEQQKNLRHLQVEEIMPRKVISVTEHTLLLDLIQLVQKHHLIRIPVVRDNKLIGIVAWSDIILGYILSLES